MSKKCTFCSFSIRVKWSAKLIKLGWTLLKRYFHIPIRKQTEANEHFAQARTLQFYIQTLHFMLSALLQINLWEGDYKLKLVILPRCFFSSANIFKFKISLLYRKWKSLCLLHTFGWCAYKYLLDMKI